MTILALSGLALCSGAWGQVLEVPRDFATIQEALDAAPSRGVVIVRGGTWDTITIRKPVTLIGDPPAVLAGGGSCPVELPNCGPWAPPIILLGQGSGDVTLSGITTGGGVPPGFGAPSRIPPGISGGNFSKLHIYDSGILAPDWTGGLSGLGYGNSAIDVGVSLIVLERSFVKGSRTDIDDTCSGNPAHWSPPPGINAPGSTVVVLDSHVQGGDMGRFQFLQWPTPQDCDPSNCPLLPGGIGISCAVLYHAGSTIEGGRGAQWSNCLSGGQGSFFCCQSPPGAPLQVGSEIPLQDDLQIIGPIRL
ncbi:MAG TPA: hypothetical protein VF530_00005, partial [Planctomycetota bacterium]